MCSLNTENIILVFFQFFKHCCVIQHNVWSSWGKFCDNFVYFSIASLSLVLTPPHGVFHKLCCTSCVSQIVLHKCTSENVKSIPGRKRCKCTLTWIFFLPSEQPWWSRVAKSRRSIPKKMFGKDSPWARCISRPGCPPPPRPPCPASSPSSPPCSPWIPSYEDMRIWGTDDGVFPANGQ